MGFISQLTSWGQTKEAEPTLGPEMVLDTRAQNGFLLCLKKYGLARLRLGCSVKCLRFQVGTSCTGGKWLGKFSHLASFHMEDG